MTVCLNVMFKLLFVFYIAQRMLSDVPSSSQRTSGLTLVVYPLDAWLTIKKAKTHDIVHTSLVKISNEVITQSLTLPNDCF